VSDLHTRLGLACPEMLLLWLPKAYRDLSAAQTELHAVPEGQKALWQLTLEQVHQRSNGARKWLQLQFTSGSGRVVNASSFGFQRPWLAVPRGARVLVQGTHGSFRGEATIENAELIEGDQVHGVQPLYRGKPGRVAAATVATTIAAQFEETAPLTVRLLCSHIGALEKQIARRIGYGSLREWLSAAHGPATLEEAERACEAAKVLAYLSATAGARRMRQRSMQPRAALKIEQAHVSEMLERFGRQPTPDQTRAITGIAQLLRSAIPMRAMLSADVGCGKSLVFWAPLLAAVRGGAQAGVLVPRDLLVDKSLAEVREMCPEINVVAVRPNTKVPSPQRGTLYVGTTAMLNALPKAGVELDVLVVDEQHVFSVAQREALLQPHTHYLEVSATPLPRSMAMLLAGGLDIFELRDRPFNRKIRTQVVAGDDRRRLFEHLRQVMDSGAQVAVIYPRVDAADGVDERASLAAMSAEWQRLFPDRVAVLSGRLSEDERRDQLERIHDGRARMIVSTTVIELGVTLPNLRSLVVVDPSRLGLMQLHQLRGRVARTGGTGRFFLFSRDGFDGDAAERMQALCDIDNGFDLAEYELTRKGAGDLSEDAADQSGMTRTLFPTIKLTPETVRRLAKPSGGDQRAAA
jgi:ATP-dependent DNA helicase RecG